MERTMELAKFGEKLFFHVTRSTQTETHIEMPASILLLLLPLLLLPLLLADCCVRIVRTHHPLSHTHRRIPCCHTLTEVAWRPDQKLESSVDFINTYFPDPRD